MGGNRAVKMPRVLEKDASNQSTEAQGGSWRQVPADYTVVSMVSITSRSDCDGERRVHSSGSQLLSGL